MQRVLGLVVALGTLALGACSNDKEHAHPDGGFVVPDEYWKPEPGETKNWDIQINAPIDVSTPRAMMIVDLFDAVPSATTLSGAAVEPGANATAIATLQANDTVVICRVGLGGVNTRDPDFALFPTDALGEPTSFDANDRYLDLAVRDTWKDFAFARLQLAKDIGCDGIEPYMADHDGHMTGFETSPDDLLAWDRTLATEAHRLKLSIGLRNGVSVPNLLDTLASVYDWSLVERCGEFGDCETVRPFINARKAVFGLDYTTDAEAGDPLVPAELCLEQSNGGIKDGLVKDVELTGTASERTQCP